MAIYLSFIFILMTVVIGTLSRCKQRVSLRECVNQTFVNQTLPFQIIAISIGFEVIENRLNNPITLISP